MLVVFGLGLAPLLVIALALSRHFGAPAAYPKTGASLLALLVATVASLVVNDSPDKVLAHGAGWCMVVVAYGLARLAGSTAAGTGIDSRPYGSPCPHRGRRDGAGHASCAAATRTTRSTAPESVSGQPPRPRRRDPRRDRRGRDRRRRRGDRRGPRPPARRSSPRPAAVSCHTLADAGTSGKVARTSTTRSRRYDRVIERVTNGKALRCRPLSGTGP